jgi:hypothetical protein
MALLPIDFAGHEGVLRSLSGKAECDRRRTPIADRRRMPLRGGFRQARDSIRDAGADERAAAGKALATDLQRVRDVREVGSGVLCQVLCQAPRPRFERVSAEMVVLLLHVAEAREDPERPLSPDDIACCPDTKCADPRSAQAVRLFPVRKARVDEEGAVLVIDLRIGALEMEAWRDLSVSNGERRFDQARDSRGDVQVAHVRLDRADRAEALRRSRRPKGSGQGRQLDRISGGVQFHEPRPDRLRVHVGEGLRNRDHLACPATSRRRGARPCPRRCSGRSDPCGSKSGP